MMRRAIAWLVVVQSVWVLGAAEACAQGGGWSGPGFYIDPLKFGLSLAVFLIWVGTSDWVGRDLLATKLDYLTWNPVVVGAFFVAFVAHWFIPLYWAGLALIVLAWAGPLFAYILYRNNLVEQHQRVMTSEHIRHWLATRLSGSGVKMDAEKKDQHETGVPVTLAATAANERDAAARLLMARQSPGMFPARKVLAEALYRRADAVMLDYTAQGVACNFLVDGVWQKGEALDRETGDPLLESLKILAGMNPQDRQTRQQGKVQANYAVFKKSVFDIVERGKEEFRKRATIDVTREMAGAEGVNPAEIEMRAKLEVENRTRQRFQSPVGTWTPVEKTDLGKLRGTERINPDTALEAMKCDVSIATAGTPTGERCVLQLEVKKTRMASLEEAGMRTKMQEQLKELTHLPHGFVLFSAPPANGLRTTINLALRDADRFVREFASLEDAANLYEPIENLHLHTYNSAAGQTPASVLEAVFHTEPHVLVVRDLVNAASAKMILQEAGENRIILSMVRAKDSIDAIQQVAAMGVPVSEVVEPLVGVFHQRLVRRLCENCREPYPPPANVLQQMGIPPGKVQVLYRPPQQREDVCPECGGVGYRGRVALFELMVVDDNVRRAIAAGGNRNAILHAARAAGMRNLQEEGVMLVVRGATSLPELIRVLKL